MITCVRHSAGMFGVGKTKEELVMEKFVESKCTVMKDILDQYRQVPMALEVSSEHKASNTSDSEIPISEVGDADSCRG